MPRPKRVLAKSKYHNNTHFLGHGMGLVSHEAPRLTAVGRCPMTTTTRIGRSKTGMVISVETTLAHPKRGFIKLEDTVVVHRQGCDIYGEGARGWNRGGTAAYELFEGRTLDIIPGSRAKHANAVNHHELSKRMPGPSPRMIVS